MARELMRSSWPCRSGRDVEERRLDLAQPIEVAARPERRVVEQKRLREPDDRVPEHRRLDRRLVCPGANLLVDELADHGHHPRLNDAVARSDDPKGGLALGLDELAQRGRLGEAAVESVEGLEQRRAAGAARLRTR